MKGQKFLDLDTGVAKKHAYVLDCVYGIFEIVYYDRYDIEILFTRETWHERMQAYQCVWAFLLPEEIENWKWNI